MTSPAGTEHPLTAARRAAGLSMEALAAKASVSTPTVYRAEHDRHRTKPATLAKLAAALGVRDADSLIREDHGLTVPANAAGTPDHNGRAGDTSPNDAHPAADHTGE